MVRKRKVKKKRNKYVGKYPVNARITIDYSKKKPKVKFEYPRKDSFSQIFYSLPVIFPGMMFGCIILLLVSINISNNNHTIEYPELDDCIVYKIFIKNTTSLIGAGLECTINDKVYIMDTELDRGNNFLFFKYPPKLDVKKVDVVELEPFFNIIIIALASLFGAWIMYKFYTKTKSGQKIFPELNKAIFNARYYTKFDKVPVNKQIEIPLFRNIYLDYKATKGFSKNLLRMEICEHPFAEIVRKGKGIKNIIKKTKKQVYLWKATFYFKDVPKDGQLEMWWT